MTKLELLAILDQYPTNAQVIFNVENDNNVLVLDDIDYLDDDFIPILSSEKPCPKIIIHLKEKKNI